MPLNYNRGSQLKDKIGHLDYTTDDFHTPTYQPQGWTGAM